MACPQRTGDPYPIRFHEAALQMGRCTVCERCQNLTVSERRDERAPFRWTIDDPRSAWCALLTMRPCPHHRSRESHANGIAAAHSADITQKAAPPIQA